MASTRTFVQMLQFYKVHARFETSGNLLNRVPITGLTLRFVARAEAKAHSLNN